MEFLSTKHVLEEVEKNPKPLNELGEFVYNRTYSRWLDERGRREYWHETVKRAIEYNLALEYSHMKRIGLPIDLKRMRTEAKKLFNNIHGTKQFPSGRTMWIGNANAKVNESFVLGNFNCSFLNISKWEDLGDLFYLLLVGTGVGFKSTARLAEKMDKIRVNTAMLHSEYNPVNADDRLEDTKLVVMENGFAKIYVGDSKEGWVNALREYFNLLINPDYEDIHTIKLSYNSVRPRGERLKTFGGTASGPEPLQEMFDGIDKVLKNQIDTELAPIEVDEKGYGSVRPVHILDIGNLVGAGVVVGGVRRTAEIFLMDADDYETMFAKYGINGFWTTEHFEQHERVRKLLVKNDIPVPQWFDDLSVRSYDGAINKDHATGEPNLEADGTLCPYNFGRTTIGHRRMSNNSVAFEKQPERKKLRLLFELMKGEGEPGFVNLREMAIRRLRGQGIHSPTEKQITVTMLRLGMNPCAEIILDSYGVCNLTTINVTAFVVDNGDGTYSLDLEGLKEAQQLSARIGLRMTLADLELPHWDAVHKRDRLVGTSMTGFMDAMSLVNYDEEQQRELLRILQKTSRTEVDNYSKELRITSPLLDTTVKPEGTISQVARNPITNSSVSSGLHVAHAPYFIRRVRINSTDPLAQVAKELDWTIHAEVGTAYEGSFVSDEALLGTDELIAVATTLVIDFPVKSGSTKSKDDVNVKQQFDTYFDFQNNYTAHNSSNTISVRPHEWEEAEDIVWDNWENFVGVSFLAEDGGTYKLAPYETITEERYEELRSGMKPFDATLLRKYESSETDMDLDTIESCSSGVCPIR